LRGAKPRGVSARDEHRGLLDRLLAAIEAGDQDRLLALLAPDAALISDGGGRVLAARNVIRGADRVARFLLGVARKYALLGHEIALLNGEPGVVRWHAGRVHSALSIAGDAGLVRAIYIVLNPDKLRRVGTVRQATAAQ
jgi:RNA polymerase sigma-70 factor, ECF subfamily